jgi:hypothetical protein
MWENNVDITYRGCRIIYEGRECKKKDKAQNPIIQSHAPSLIAESGLDELVGFSRFYSRDVSFPEISPLNLIMLDFILIRAEMKSNLMGHHNLSL